MAEDIEDRRKYSFLPYTPVERQRRHRERHPAYYVWLECRHRARKLGIDFELNRHEWEARIDALTCEATGQPLQWLPKRNPYLPSIDKIDPTQGYTQENSRVVSWRFNRSKNDMTDAEFAELAEAFLAHHKGQ